MRALATQFVLVLVLVAGCSGPPARRIETHLGRNARIVVDGREVERDGRGVLALEPLRSRFKASFVDFGGLQVPIVAGVREAAPSFPAVVHLEPGGTYPLRVERRGFQTFETTLTIRPREYTLVAVRLAEEREPA